MERHGRRVAALAATSMGLLLAACAVTPTDPATLFQLSSESAARRASETRRFETRDEAELLSASAAALQDLGFQVTESVRELGFLRAAKERSARERGQEIWRGVLFAISTVGLVGGSNTLQLIPVDLHQQINASLVTRQVDEDAYEVRILFYRVVWQSDGMSGDQTIPPGQQRLERIRDPVLYQQFFARLSKAVFLEAHKI
ncbi:MAG: hypothetical protein ABFS41_06530 [Myxococcota bacterium]